MWIVYRSNNNGILILQIQIVVLGSLKFIVLASTAHITTENALCDLHGHHWFYFQENLAFGRYTDQISTQSGFDSSRAVDGKSNTSLFAGSACAHTQNANQPWWRVDLGREEPVSELYIVNRGDCCGAQLENFEIRVGRSGYYTESDLFRITLSLLASQSESWCQSIDRKMKFHSHAN